MTNKTLKSNTFCLNPIAEHSAQSDFAVVLVKSELQQNGENNQFLLNLNYQILSTHAIDFDDFSQNNVKATDYLWKKNCLECFIQINNQQYFEINASPNGAYALYHFDDYRTPKQMPPRATEQLQFNWQKQQINVENFHVKNIAINDDTSLANLNFLSTFGFEIVLPKDLQLTKINPCVILYQQGEPIFYAVNHANPPDFHNKDFWQNF